MGIERHYRIREAAQLCGAGSRRTMLRWLELDGWVPARRQRGRVVLVPEHAIQRILDRRAMRPKYLRPTSAKISVPELVSYP